MNRLKRKTNKRPMKLESLENRELLDAGLGSEIADFASQDELKTTLMDKAVEQHQWLFGQEQDPWRFGCPDCFFLDGGNGGGFFGGGIPVPEVAPPLAVDAPLAPSAPSGDALVDPDFSDTNTQVDGVDEGDIVETDGNYVYVLSENLMTIVDVRDQDHPRISSRIHLSDESFGSEMYLDGDRLMVASTGFGIFTNPLIDVPFLADAIWEPPHQSTVITVIDVSDREDATIVSETKIDGSITNSRAIDGTGYFIVSDNLAYPQPKLNEVRFISEDGKLERTINIYETEEEYRSRVEPTILDALPNYTTYDQDRVLTETGVTSDFTTTFSTNDPNYGSIVSIVTIDMHEELPSVETGTSVLMNSGHDIFMSRENLYMFQNRWDLQDSTSIMKFDLNADEEDGNVVPTASGVVSGHMLDQFSADEYNGDLRVATTSGWGRDSTSGVYVLNETGDDDKLTIKGAVAGLAKGERIFSARFVGTQGYIVTFRQVDPLFSINLSDPNNPVVEGELKIPGFSEYMQPIDENTILAIGRDADPVTGRSEGLQISLFDVTDKTDPQLVDRYTFEGGNSTYSPAEHDHHAFSYFPDQEVLAVPVSGRDGGAWLRTQEDGRFWVPAQWNQAVHVFDVDKQEGFDFTGAVDHPSEVRRSVRVDEKLYTISRDTVKVSELAEPSEVIGQVYYLPPANGGVVPDNPTPRHVDRVFAAAATSENVPRWDMDGNELVNSDDATFLVEAAAQTNPGDTNFDGKVNFVDFLQFAANFGEEGGWADGDFNGDGIINFADFTILSANYGGFQA